MKYTDNSPTECYDTEIILSVVCTSTLECGDYLSCADLLECDIVGDELQFIITQDIIPGPYTAEFTATSNTYAEVLWTVDF